MARSRHVVIAVALLVAALLGGTAPVAAAAGSDTTAADASDEPLDLSKTTVGLVKDVVADTERILHEGVTL